MHSRLFARTILSGFAIGLIAGFQSGGIQATLEVDERNKGWMLTSAPGIVGFMAIALGVSKARVNERPDSALSTAIGLGVGFYLGYLRQSILLSAENQHSFRSYAGGV